MLCVALNKHSMYLYICFGQKCAQLLYHEQVQLIIKDDVAFVKEIQIQDVLCLR